MGTRHSRHRHCGDHCRRGACDPARIAGRNAGRGDDLRITPARTAHTTPRGREVISELDIYRAANVLIDRHGADALIAAARMIDRMLELGDPEGPLVWKRIKGAIEQLQAAPTAMHLSAAEMFAGVDALEPAHFRLGMPGECSIRADGEVSAFGV